MSKQQYRAVVRASPLEWDSWGLEARPSPAQSTSLSDGGGSRAVNELAQPRSTRPTYQTRHKLEQRNDCWLMDSGQDWDPGSTSAVQH